MKAQTYLYGQEDLAAGIRGSSSERKALQKGLNKTLQQLEQYCKHVRGNTNDIKSSAGHIKNTAANIQWELSELRTGGKSSATGGPGMTTRAGSPIIIGSLKVAERCLQHQGQKAAGKAGKMVNAQFPGRPVGTSLCH